MMGPGFGDEVGKRLMLGFVLIVAGVLLLGIFIGKGCDGGCSVRIRLEHVDAGGSK